MPALLGAIPESRRDAVHAALTATFGPSKPSALAPILGGASGALGFRIDIGGRSYALRLDRLDRDLMRDPHRHYGAMGAAAGAGLAPALHYADPVSAIAIMDFIEAQPLTDFPGGREALARAFGTLFARLQSTEVFPAFATAQQVIGGLWAHVGRSGLFAPGLIAPHLAAYERLRAAYPWGALAAVSSHNDPNFRNVLFDGQRLWLIDWETAYPNDPLFDLAIVSKEMEADATATTALLTAWAGVPPSDAVKARLLLMQHMTRMYYAGLVFAGFAASPGADPIDDLTPPSPDEVRAAVAEGRIAMGSPELMRAIGKSMLAGFLIGATTAETDEAMVRAREGL